VCDCGVIAPAAAMANVVSAEPSPQFTDTV
jgi:hypothetical protein